MGLAVAMLSAGAGTGGAAGTTRSGARARLAPTRQDMGIGTGASASVRVPALAVRPPAGAAYLGEAEPSTALDVEVVLAPRDEGQLARLVSAVSSPSSPSYHHFLTEREFESRFAPSPATVRAAESWLGAEGLDVSRPTPFAVRGSGTVGQISAAFGVRFGRYSEHGGATSGLVAAGSPQLPAQLSGGLVTGVIGLDTLAKPFASLSRPLRLRAGREASGTSAGVAPKTGAAASGAPHPAISQPAVSQPAVSEPVACAPAATTASGDDSYTADEVAEHYQLAALEGDGQDGAGVTIALPEVNASSSSDISAYQSCFGLTNPVSVVNVDGGPTQPVSLGEADIDIEMAATAAPGASISAYEAPDSDQGLLDAVGQIVGSGTAEVISMSIGQCESDTNFVDGMHTYLMEAAARGESVLASVGDTGSEGCFSYDASHNPSNSGDSLRVLSPASDPLVTSVGGTVLSDGTDLAWNDCLSQSNPPSCADALYPGGATGGGASQVYSSGPSGQPAVDGSGGAREVPDVAAEAGSNYGDDVVMYSSGSWAPWLGTSLAAPLWAGLVADRDSSCTSGTGDFDPELYSLYAGYYTDAFTAVPDAFNPPGGAPVPGNNDFTGDHGGDYPTASSYDLDTGIGTPVATGLGCSQVVGSYSGQAGGLLTLEGLGLENAAITFGSAAAEVLTASATSVDVQVPSGSGTVTIVAHGPLGESTRTGTFSYPGGGAGAGGGGSFPVLAPTTTTVPPTATTAPVVLPAPPAPPTTVGTRAKTSPRLGYWMVGSDGGVFGFGRAGYFGSLVSLKVRALDIVAIAPGPGGAGYWLAEKNGNVYHFGRAGNFETMAGHPLHVDDIAAIAPMPDGSGYWLAGSNGAVYAFGSARSYGSVPRASLGAARVVGFAASPDGHGYWLAGSGGQVWHFGDAPDLGSLRASALESGTRKTTIVAIAAGPASPAPIASPTPAARAARASAGFWLVARNGLIFNFGGAEKFGPSSWQKAAGDVVGVAPTPDGAGLWVVTAAGAVTSYGDAYPEGSLPELKVSTSSVVGMASL